MFSIYSFQEFHIKDYFYTIDFSGYIIWTSSRLHNGTLGLNVIVQGPKDPDHVLSRIENFIETFQVNIDLEIFPNSL